MKNVIVALFTLTFIQSIYSQENYTVNWGTSTYDTLSTYTSILYEILPEPYMSNEEIEIDFGFDFPFFDKYFTSVNIDANGIGYFSNSEYVFQLFAFEGSYLNHYNLPIFSDWRYANETVDEMGVLKIEWRNVGIDDDIWSSNPTNHRINFQMWLFENGVIEYHFGDTDLSETPFYSEETGFVWEDGESYGPWIGIINDDSESEVYYISGTNDSIFLITDSDNADIYFDVPVIGQYFRFTPDEVTDIQTEQISKLNEIAIYPNPGHDLINVRIAVQSVFELFDMNGQLVLKENFIGTEGTVNSTFLQQGTYVYRITSSDGLFETGKWVKQ